MYVCIIIRLAYSLICSGLHGCFFGGCSSLGSQWNGTILGSLILAESFTKRMLAEVEVVSQILDGKVPRNASIAAAAPPGAAYSALWLWVVCGACGVVVPAVAASEAKRTARRPRAYIAQKQHTTNAKVGKVEVTFKVTAHNGRSTDYGRPMKPFFIKIPNFRAWADNFRQFGRLNFGHLGYFRPIC